MVFLPDDPRWLLFVLREAARLLNRAKRPLPMVLLSRSPAPWLWQTLLHRVGDRRLLAAVQAVSSDLPCRRLAALLQGGPVGYPGLQQLSAIEALARGKPPSGLSKIELNATLALLYGHSITSRAQIRGVSQKNALQPKNLRTKQDGGVSSASGEPISGQPKQTRNRSGHDRADPLRT